MAMTYASPLDENMFGKMRGRFDEASAREAVEEIIKRIVNGFASLSHEDRQRCIAAFNDLHNAPERCERRYELRNVNGD